MNKPLYYIVQTGERVKINSVYTSGLCECVNRRGEKVYPFIGDLKKVQ